MVKIYEDLDTFLVLLSNKGFFMKIWIMCYKQVILLYKKGSLLGSGKYL